MPGRHHEAEQSTATEPLTGSTARRGQLATAAVTNASRFDAREAFIVTLCMFGMGFLAHTLSEHLIAATSGMLLPFPVAPGTIQKLISSLVLALNVAAFGIGVGLQANRRTMTASIIAASAVSLLFYFFMLGYLYITLPRQAWGPNTFPIFRMLLQTVAITATEVAVAHYVARKFRKEP